MPIYEFKCNDCCFVFEELVFSSSVEDKNIICPECGAKNANKLMSAFSAAGTEPISSGPPGCGSTGFG